MRHAKTLLVLLLLTITTAITAQTIEISGRHQLQIDSQTQILIEGELVSPLDALLAPGIKLTALEMPNRGALPLTLIFDFDLRGIVTSTNPVTVLGTPLALSAETTLVGWDSPDDIGAGDAVVVSGQFDINGSLSAGFLERLPEPTATWRLAGYVTELGAEDSLRIGDQLLDVGGIAATDCTTPINPGDFVIARADAIADFMAGDTIDTVTRLTCAQPAPFGTPGAAGGLEGVIDSLPAEDRFVLEGLLILHDQATTFGNGSIDDLEPGALIELEGTFIDAVTVQADTIEFVRPVLRMEAPAGPADVVPNESISLLGLTVIPDPQTRDDDGIVANGLSQPTQVQVRGWVDREGGLHATRVRERGNPDALDLSLRGPVANIAAPMLTIVGLPVNTDSSVFEDEFGTPLTGAEFFALATAGDIVEISGARHDSDDATLIGGVMTYIGPVAARVARGGAAARVLYGTITMGLFPQRLFIDGFEEAP